MINFSIDLNNCNELRFESSEPTATTDNKRKGNDRSISFQQKCEQFMNRLWFNQADNAVLKWQNSINSGYFLIEKGFLWYNKGQLQWRLLKMIWN